MDAILHIPSAATEDDHNGRRSAMRRRRSEDQDENAATPADAGESDAVMTYLREIGRVPMITHEREIELAKRIEAGDRDAMKQFILANLRLSGKYCQALCWSWFDVAGSDSRGKYWSDSRGATL